MRPEGRVVSVRSGDLVLYADEVCDAGTCCRPRGHEGRHDQFDSKPSPDALRCHPPDPEPAVLQLRIVELEARVRELEALVCELEGELACADPLCGCPEAEVDLEPDELKF